MMLIALLPWLIGFTSGLLSSLIGFTSGLRSLIPPAILCWSASLGWLPLSQTKLAFIGKPPALALVTLLAVGELIADKLPQTPARTKPSD